MLNLTLNREQIDKICRRHGILLLVEFGSRAAGTARPDSDCDLAVLLERPPGTLEERFGLEEALAWELGIPARLDLVILNDLGSTTLGREIARGGQVLFDVDGDRWPAFVCRAMRDYADFEKFRVLRNKVLRGEPIE